MQLKGKVKFVNKDKSNFFPTLKSRVDAYFEENNISKNANSTMVIKTLVLIVAYFVPFAVILFLNPPLGQSLLLWSLMGVSLAGIGMSVMHDANHGAYSEKKWVNALLGYTLNILGGSVFNWKLQHNILHHTYTNVAHMDDDIDDKLVLRFNPHGPVKWYHKLQFVYAFFFYGILTIYWVTLKDFVQFITYTRNGVNPNNKQENAITLARIMGVKIFYFFTHLVVPTLVFGIPFWYVFLGWTLMHFIGGVILTVVFQLAHTVEGTSHPLPNAEGNIENAWAIHQLNTTVNFARHNKVLNWYLGGLNFQVEHHLFPKICHVHYPAIAPIVKETAEEFGIPYLENPTFWVALDSHIATLRRFGRLPDMNDAIG